MTWCLLSDRCDSLVTLAGPVTKDARLCHRRPGGLHGAMQWTLFSDAKKPICDVIWPYISDSVLWPPPHEMWSASRAIRYRARQEGTPNTDWRASWR